LIRLIALTALLCFSVACGTSRPGAVSRENDRLRRQNLELEREVDALQTALQRRDAELLEAEKQRGRDSQVEGAQPLRLTGLEFSRYSGPIDTNGDGRDDIVRIYLKPKDQHDRVMSVTGEAVLQLAVIEGNDARVVAERRFAPAQFDATFRSGFTGTHFTLEIDLPSGLDGVVAKLTFTDAATARDFTQQQAWPVR
jgi:hypothetical protein